MHTGTGEIRNFTDADLAKLTKKERKNWVVLTPEQHELLSGMNREQRRKYFKAHKKEFGWLSWSGVNEASKQS
jgi:hypothetical protein